MWICPVCGKANREGLLCERCGFDESLHYKKYRTLTEVDAGQTTDVSGRITEEDACNFPDFDVFLCCQEADESGERTSDCVLAEELYHRLTKEGFRVFLPWLTPEGIRGTSYASGLSAALESARAMVVLGTRSEHFHAAHVQNQWSRYLDLIKKDSEKIMIPAYRDMVPEDLPEEISHLQALDISGMGFILDVIQKLRRATVADATEKAPLAEEETLLESRDVLETEIPVIKLTEKTEVIQEERPEEIQEDREKKRGGFQEERTEKPEVFQEEKEETRIQERKTGRPAGEKRPRRTTLPVLVALAAIICLAAVGVFFSKNVRQKETETETAAVAGAATEAAGNTQVVPAANGEGLKIGVCFYAFDDNFMSLYRQELQKYLEEIYGAEVTVVDGKGDQVVQTNQIDTFIAQGVDVLILNLVQASATETVAKTCADAGIPAVFIELEPDASEIERWERVGVAATYVGADARQSGTFQGEIILETPNKGDINGDGKVSYVMLIGAPENMYAQYRTEFSVKALTDAGVEVEELSASCGYWDPEIGRVLTDEALAEFGDKIEVVFANDDAMALGAIEAIEAWDRKMNEDIYLVGADGLDEATTAIRDGRMTGTVLNDYVGQSHTAADVAIQMANGEKVDTKYTVDYIKVTE